jgi:multimeric flavodoxin WrbA
MKIMKPNLTRRNFLVTAGAAALATGLARGAAETSESKSVKMLGIACSPRKGMTTARAVQTALDAARAVDARIAVELLDLGGLSIAGWSPKPPKDDFDAILPKLKDPQLGGLIIGSPAYFRSLSSLCKAFIERCMPLREGKMLLADKPVGALAVAGNRNGGQELVVQQILTAMISYGMVPVGGKSPAMLGGTLWNTKDDVSQDELGLQSAKLLGAHVAEVALKLFKNP